MTLYSTPQVADVLGFSAWYVRKLAAKEGFGTRVGRDWVFDDADIARFRNRPDYRTREHRRLAQ